MTASLPLVRRLVAVYLAPQMRDIVASLVLMIVAALMTGAMAKLMEPIIDKVFTAKNKSMLLPVGGLVLLVFAVRGLATYFYKVILDRIGRNVIARIQNQLFAQILRSDVATLQRAQSGELQSRILSDSMMIRRALNETLAGIGKSSFSLVFLVALMFWQDWKLALSSFFVFPAVVYIVARLGRRLRKVSTDMQVEIGRMMSLLGQAFQGNMHVRAYGMEDFEEKRVGGLIDRVFRLYHKVFRVGAIGRPAAEILGGLAVVAIVLYGGHQVMAGETTAGRLFSFITAFLMALEPMKRLAALNSIMQIGLAAADRTFRFLDARPAVQDKPGAAALAAESPAVRFENVSFSYADGTQALRNVSFEAPAGRTVALVGASGAGKSTILALLPRFYDVTEGAITIGGTDIRDVTLESLRRSMALVSQDVAIFNDSVRDNILYGRPDAMEEEMIAAAKDAVAHDFIMDLPQGYDTLLGEKGVKLSGGQRQRISIARAMLRGAPILLLDEATSALDATSEQQVQEALERLQKGRTTIVVAHRLSTIIKADRIYVLDDGQVVEQGTHGELARLGGIYAGFYGEMAREAG